MIVLERTTQVTTELTSEGTTELETSIPTTDFTTGINYYQLYIHFKSLFVCCKF